MNKIKTRIFGTKNTKKDQSAETIQKLRNMEELLEKKQEFLEKKINDEIQIAKKNGLTNKRAALQALMRKKRYQKQLQQIDGTLTTLELQREALEMAHSNTAVLKTMTDAAKALKTAHEHLKVDNVHDMMDDIAEQQDLAREISDAISNPVAFSADVDADELEKELEDLAQEELDLELLAIEPTPVPEVTGQQALAPSKGGPSKTRGEESHHSDEEAQALKELEQWGLS